jgi:chromosome segregation ATPase
MSDTAILAALDRVVDGQSRIEAGVADLRSGQADLRAGQADLRSGLAELRAGLDRLEENNSRLEAGLRDALISQRQELTADIDRLRFDLMERLDKHSAILTALQDDITVNFASADVAQRANDHTRQELRGLREMVSGMERQIRRLQERVAAIEGGL